MQNPNNNTEQSTQIGLKIPLQDSSKTSRFDFSDKNALSLHCFFQVNDQWQHKQFSHRTKSVKIGPTGTDNEIGLNDNDLDKVQVIISRIENNWYIMECGKNDLMKVDGIPKRQIILHKKKTCVLQIGKSILIVCLTDKSDESPKLHKSAPKDNEFSLAVNENSQYSFSSDFPCLIGSNPFCNFWTGSKDFLSDIPEKELKTFEKPFLGIIYRIGSRLLIQGFDEEIQVDDQQAIDPIILSPENKISIGRIPFNLHLPATASGTEPVSTPKLKEAIFCLLPLNDPDGHIPELHIPTSARSLTLGRSSQQSDISINDINISRQHSQFIIYPKSMMIYDCGSSNGTFVNEEKITKKTIKPGDIISLGEIAFFYCYADD